MEMQPVKSSTIESIGYDKGIMHVAYKGGNIYHFTDVSPQQHENIVKSRSVGSALSKLKGIKGHHPGHKPE
jgi:hypothetical protein